MSDDAPPSKIVAGQWPPDLLPYCQLCDMIVERLGVTPFKYHHQDFLVLEAKCCGQTRGARIPLREVFRLRDTGQKWYIITRKGLNQGARGRLRTNFAGMHG